MIPSNEKHPLVAHVNVVIYSLMSPEHSAAFQMFFNNQWNRVYEKVKECVLSHKDQGIEEFCFVVWRTTPVMCEWQSGKRVCQSAPIRA